MKKRWIPFIAIAAMIGISSIATADETEMDFYISEDDSEEVLVAAAEEDEESFAVDGLIEDLEAADDGAVENVPIDEEHFPDSSFRNYISENFDLPDSEGSKDGVLSKEELNKITSMEISSSSVSSIEGIHYFPMLETIVYDGVDYTSSTIQTSPTIQNCPSLSTLIITGQIVDLTVNNCPCLSTLDLSRASILGNVNCADNNISTLSLGKWLRTLDCSNNAITNLDLTMYPSLESLTCNNNLLTSLDLTKCRWLKELNCADNQLSTLDVSECSNLSVLDCQRNMLKSLKLYTTDAEVEGLSLNKLDCSENRLTSLEDFGSVMWLSCKKNQIKSLDLTHTFLKTVFQNGTLSEADGISMYQPPHLSTYFTLICDSSVSIQTNNHSYGAWKVVKTATALSTGSKIRICSHCDYKQSQAIPKLKASVSLTKTKLKLKKGKKKTLKIKSMTKGDQILKWTTSKKKIATVSKKGEVKAKKKGKCVITVVMKSGATAKCTITVK